MNKKITLDYAFRAGTVEDYPYILNSWMRTWRFERANKQLSDTMYYKQAEQMFKGILNKYGSIIACNPDFTMQIYGYAVAAYLPEEDWALFWIQVKKNYGNIGIGTALYNFIRGDRKHGPFCPFIKRDMRTKIQKYDLVDAPYMIAKLLTMPTVTPATEIFEEK